eukprot:NODE_30904_length_408_cov_0.822064.p2 GENE.NODE_30904_length_408_cov_0.822064~~NODE_30904_length_408_cov_0.822064.p2  ORF type:complete len:51 (-),score=14.63 NODE_30904_length_408_cov_0.822064:148-300(-)
MTYPARYYRQPVARGDGNKPAKKRQRHVFSLKGKKKKKKKKKKMGWDTCL